jgi:hypothetical protein
MAAAVISDSTDPISFRAATRPSWNPLVCTGTDLPTNLTIMVKSLAFVLLITNHVQALPYPWLAFIPSMNSIPGAPFQYVLQVVFYISMLAIIFNRRVRLSSLVLGTVILISVVASKEYYANNRTFCGLMFFLSGLYKPGMPNIVGWQLALTYFGAGLNKLLDIDWHTGVFFQNWAANRLKQPIYIAMASRLPTLWLGKFFCWFTIVAELGIVPALLIPRLYYWAVLTNVFFQISLLLFTGMTFGLFTFGMTAASFAFFKWPDSPISIVYDSDSSFAMSAQKLLRMLDLDKRFSWMPYREATDANPRIVDIYSGTGLYVVVKEKVYSGFRALRIIILLNPITYFFMAGSIAAFDHVRPGDLPRRILASVFLVLLMPPLAWIADKLSGGGMSQRSVVSFKPTSVTN